MCAWLAIMNSWGFVNSFGAFQTYYTSILPESPSTISWIGSTQACLVFCLGVFSGRALDAGYFRPTIMVGIVFQLVGIFTMSVAKTYWQLLLTQGICTGIGGGIFFVPIVGLCSTYFAKRRGMALGIVTSGNSAGGIVYPIVVRQLLGKIGFGWTVRVLDFVNVVSLAVVIAFMRLRLPPRKTGPLLDMAVLKDVPYMLHVLGMCFNMPAIYFVFYYVRHPILCHLESYLFAFRLHLSLGTNLGCPITIYSISLLSSIASVHLRVFLPGYTGGTHIGVLNTLIICLLSNIIILWSWLAVSSTPAYYVFTVLYGLFGAVFNR
jgi:MFS family permease